MLEVYIDDYIALAVPTTQDQMGHVANGVLTGIQDVIPKDNEDDNNPISLKKLKKLEGSWSIQKDMLGFTFDGDGKTLCLDASNPDVLLVIHKGWIRSSCGTVIGIPFTEF